MFLRIGRPFLSAQATPVFVVLVHPVTELGTDEPLQVDVTAPLKLVDLVLGDVPNLFRKIDVFWDFF